MRRLCIIIVLLISALGADAQPLWSELSPSVQIATIRSRRTPKVVREVMLSDIELKQLDAPTRAQLLQRVTSRCMDQNLAALYLYIYNGLREPNGSMAQCDVRMVSLYAEPILKLWAQDSTSGKIYNWAYSLGSYSAMGGEAKVRRVVKKLTNKKLLASYGSQVYRFNSAYGIAYASVSAGKNSFNDITPPAVLYDTFTPEGDDLYNAVNSASAPIVASLAEAHSNIDVAMRAECMAWNGAYHTAIKHNLGKGIFLTHTHRADGEYLTIADAHGDSYTLNNEMFLLDNGYFVAIKRLASPHGIIVGRFLQRGGFVILGERNLDYGTKILGVKCAGQSIYLHVEAEDKAQKYLNYTIR